MALSRREMIPDAFALIACTRGVESDNLREGRPSHGLRNSPHDIVTRRGLGEEGMVHR